MKSAPNSSVGVAVVKPLAGREPTTFAKTGNQKLELLDETQAAREAHAQRVRDNQRMNQEFMTVAEKLAHTEIFIRGVTVMPLVEAFPGQFMNWCISQVFPNAKGGVLYVDLAYSPYDVEQCRRKAVVMRKAGLRYVWIEENDTVESAERKLKGELK